MTPSYQIAESFISTQGEGIYSGTLMAFIRFTGCSVSKKICQHCDTDFENMNLWNGGGLISGDGLVNWVHHHAIDHVCFTGGEPLDQPNLLPLVEELIETGRMIHIETSGTVKYHDWMSHDKIWITMSPKPGWLRENITPTHEFKVIVNGLGTGHPWPTIDDALELANKHKKTVFLQPRNKKYEVDYEALRIVQDLIHRHPELRLSVQLHKILKVR